jgi:hypothetical protein
MTFRVYNRYIVAAIANVGSMLFGLDISSASAFVGQDQYHQYFTNPDSLTQGGIPPQWPVVLFSVL